MTEPLRTAPDRDGSADADRDALIERLLLAGLDHYFEGRYEQAVNVWTRVAFLERGHGRARAYIERARGAIAERQRQSDELLDRGVDAYRAGDLAGARDLLTRAVADGGSETALVFLQRLGIAEAGQAAFVHGGNDLSAAAGLESLRNRAKHALPERTNWLLTIAVSAGVAAGILLAAQPIASWLGEWPVDSRTTVPRASDAVPIVRISESRLIEARGLYSSGRLRDALQVLDRIDKADPLRGDADALTAAIQTDLLATVKDTSATPDPRTPREVVR